MNRRILPPKISITDATLFLPASYCSDGASGRIIVAPPEHGADTKNTRSSNPFVQDLRASRLVFQQTDPLGLTNSHCGDVKGKKRQFGDDHYKSSLMALSRARVEPSSTHPSTTGLMPSATSSVVMHRPDEDAGLRILPLGTRDTPTTGSTPPHSRSIRSDERYRYLFDYLRASSKGKK